MAKPLVKPLKPVKPVAAAKPAGTSYGSTRSAAVNKGQQGKLMSAAGKKKAATNKAAALVKKTAAKTKGMRGM